ncbi:hypothetical protein D3C72_502760 [compost metagenome]
MGRLDRRGVRATVRGLRRRELAEVGAPDGGQRPRAIRAVPNPSRQADLRRLLLHVRAGGARLQCGAAHGLRRAARGALRREPAEFGGRDGPALHARAAPAQALAGRGRALLVFQPLRSGARHLGLCLAVRVRGDLLGHLRLGRAGRPGPIHGHRAPRVAGGGWRGHRPLDGHQAGVRLRGGGPGRDFPGRARALAPLPARRRPGRARLGDGGVGARRAGFGGGGGDRRLGARPRAAESGAREHLAGDAHEDVGQRRQLARHRRELAGEREVAGGGCRRGGLGVGARPARGPLARGRRGGGRRPGRCRLAASRLVGLLLGQRPRLLDGPRVLAALRRGGRGGLAHRACRQVFRPVGCHDGAVGPAGGLRVPGGRAHAHDRLQRLHPLPGARGPRGLGGGRRRLATGLAARPRLGLRRPHRVCRAGRRGTRARRAPPHRSRADVCGAACAGDE